MLASLQRGQIQLRKVSAAPRTQSPAADLRSDLMSAIRQGVALRKVREAAWQPGSLAADPAAGALVQLHPYMFLNWTKC